MPLCPHLLGLELRRIVRFLLALLSAPLLLAQHNWTPDPQNETTANLWGIGFGDATLLAVGEQGTILRFDYNQPDAGWQPRGANTSAWLLGAVHAAGRWVIVGDAGAIFVSEDGGDTWIPRSSGVTARLNAVAHGNGRWIAIGEAGAVVTSTDAETWETRPALGPGFLRALAFGQGRWLLGGANGALYTTTDATTFTRVSLNTTADLEAAAISPQRFFVAGSRGFLATATSLDNWQTTTATPATLTFRGLVARADDTASAVSDGAAYLYSTAWTLNTLRPDFLATSAVLGRDESIAVGFHGGIARSSSLYSVTVSSTYAVNVIYGEDIRLTATIAGPATGVSYQWTRDGVALPGQTRSEFALSRAAWADAGNYSVRATATSRTLEARAVRLNVIPGGRPEVIDSTFNYSPAETPSAVFPAPDGKLYVTYTASNITGGYRTALTRLHADGSVDLDFRPPLASADASLSLVRVFPDGRLLVTGSFANTGATTVLLRPDGSIDPTFNPPASARLTLTSLLATTGGRFIAPSATGIVRLLPDGTPDSAFKSITGASLLGVDSAGRVYVTTLTTTRSEYGYIYYTTTTVRRYGTDGSPEPTPIANFSSSDYPIGSYSYLSGMLGDWLFARYTDRGKIYGSAYLAGFHLDDRTVRVASGGAYAQYLTATSALPTASGTVWEMRPSQELNSNSIPLYSMTAAAYLPNVGRTHTRYATLPDLSGFQPIAAAADGALYARPHHFIAGARPLKPLVRIRPLAGRVGRLTNLSVRSHVTAAAPLIVGFVTSGTGSTRVLVRGLGPALAPFGVADALRDPALALRRGTTDAGANDDWNPALAPGFAALGAFPLRAGSRDAALEASIADGNYTATLTTTDAQGGTALVELFESSADFTPSRTFVNVSARGPVAPDRPLIVGFTLTGETPARVLIRAAGPALRQFGVTGWLGDPMLRLYRQSTALWENDTWTSGSSIEKPPFDARTEVIAASEAVGAFPLVPSDQPAMFGRSSADAAMLVTLAPGSYTAQIAGLGSQPAGTALIEVYLVP